MSEKAISPEQREIEKLQSELRRLTHTVEALLIKNAGITELEGDYIEVFDEADKTIARRTTMAIDKNVRRKELHRLESQIFNLEQQARQIREDNDLRSEVSENPYIQFHPQTYTVATGIGMPINTASTIPKEYYVK